VNPVEIGAGVAASNVRNEVERVLTSEGFAHSPRLQRFLAYLVDRTLEGRAYQIKEYAIAVDVFDRSPDFDGRTDTIVRSKRGASSSHSPTTTAALGPLRASGSICPWEGTHHSFTREIRWRASRALGISAFAAF
jgi:hypothetical protein